MNREQIRQVLCEVFNELKRTSLFSPENVGDEMYLGGDLGFDSIEMLEAWVDIQKRLAIKIQDQEMIDILQVSQVLDLIQLKLVG